MAIVKRLSLLFICFFQSLLAAELETENFVVTITQKCPEGHVTCDKVTYHGVSKKTGNSISLTGSTMHSKCADGATPCSFQGYKFVNGNITYLVLGDGTLQVVQGKDKVLLEEQGVWKY